MSSPRKGMYEPNDVRKANNPTIIQQKNTGWAFDFNGTDEYLQIALPAELAGFNPATISGGNAPTGWAKNGVTTITYETTESGSSGCMKCINGGADYRGIFKIVLTINKKYKTTIRYKSTVDIWFGNTISEEYKRLKLTSEWNNMSFVYTPTVNGYAFIGAMGAGTFWIESLTIKEDQGFDLNKDQEMILHSKNWDFERTLGVEKVTNGTMETGSPDSTGWYFNNGVRSKVTGNGFTGNAQRVYCDVTVNTFMTQTITGLNAGSRYVVSIRHRNNNGGTLYFTNSAPSAAIELIANEGQAIQQEAVIMPTATTVDLRVYVRSSSGNATLGDWVEVDDITVREIPNLVTNGTFDSATGWSLSTGWTIGSGVVTCNGTNFVLCSTTYGLAQIGKKYRISLEIKNYVSGALTVQMGGTGADVGNWTSNGIKNIDYTPTTTGIFFLYSRNFSGSVDNIHIYEIPEWTSIGNHTCDVSTLDKSGTTGQSLLVSASGAGNTSNCVTLPSANLESCVSGKKYTLQGEGRLDPASLTYGSEIITVADNRTFDSDTGFWSKNNTVITGGMAVGTNVTHGSSMLFSRSIGQVGKTYKVTYTIKNYISGAVRTGMGNQGTSVLRSANGTYTDYVTATINWLDFVANATTSLSLDDISVVEATPPTITAQLGTKSVTSSALSIVAGTFTKFVLNFEATASEVNQDLKLYLNGAGSVFVDKLSLTQAYDMWVGNKIKVNTDTFKKIVNTYTGNNGYALYKRSEVKQWYAFVNDGNTSESVVTCNSTIGNNVFRSLGLLLNRTNNMELFENGVSKGTPSSMIGEGKILIATSMEIGTINGQISHLQIIRFENISQSTFNPAITGLQYPTGGGAEEVLRLTFSDGTSFANCVKDYSPKNHSLSNPGSTMDLNNRKRVV